jgi:hypothetical protein
MCLPEQGNFWEAHKEGKKHRASHPFSPDRQGSNMSAIEPISTTSVSVLGSRFIA